MPHPVVPAQTILHRLQTPRSGRQNKTSLRLHSRTFRHSTAVKPSDRSDSGVRQHRSRAGVGVRQPVREGGGASHERTPVRLRGPVGEDLRPFPWAPVGGACRPDNPGAFLRKLRAQLRPTTEALLAAEW